MSEKQIMDDMRLLSRMPEFNRFLFRVIQKSGIWSSTTNGSEGRNLVSEGRRQLGFEILAEVDAAQPVPGPDGIPILTIMQVFREAAQQQPEKPNARHDRNAELSDPTEDDAD